MGIVIVIRVNGDFIGEGRETKGHAELGPENGALTFVASAKVAKIGDNDMTAFSNRACNSKAEAVEN